MNVDEGVSTTSSASANLFEAGLESDGGVRKIRRITQDEAIQLRKLGSDVVVCGIDLAANRKLAGSIEQQANGKWRRCSPHDRAGPKALPHFQPDFRGPAGHTFYETQHRKAID
jgi:hypothetical protein